jgi:hypothetical protein
MSGVSGGLRSRIHFAIKMVGRDALGRVDHAAAHWWLLAAAVEIRHIPAIPYCAKPVMWMMVEIHG